MSDKSRRKLLKSIAAGSGAVIAGKSLPESWVKPVVDSVMLPAHAQTSTCAFGITATSTLPFSLTPPGPNVPFGLEGTITVTVTPAPADGETILLEGFVDGAYIGEDIRPLTGGVSTGYLGADIAGAAEIRATYDCAVTSIYFNVLPAPPNTAPPASSGNIFSG